MPRYDCFFPGFPAIGMSSLNLADEQRPRVNPTSRMDDLRTSASHWHRNSRERLVAARGMPNAGPYVE